ncbi:hypothetical protein ACIBU0_08690 [Streptomyces sp. NPDC049627]|uniref:hypothetical protein n=1 Tax=Streptomyces sp. NPDC049627 TaxID=3365595 RepID=UPI0037912F0C
MWTAMSLTASSLVPPLLSGANATTSALLGLHLVPATLVIPPWCGASASGPIDSRVDIKAGPTRGHAGYRRPFGGPVDASGVPRPPMRPCAWGAGIGRVSWVSDIFSGSRTLPRGLRLPR